MTVSQLRLLGMMVLLCFETSPSGSSLAGAPVDAPALARAAPAGEIEEAAPLGPTAAAPSPETISVRRAPVAVTDGGVLKAPLIGMDSSPLHGEEPPPPQLEEVSNRLVLEDPGVILVREGSHCAESPGALREGHDIVIDAAISLPDYVTHATVFLNGWRLLYIDDSLACTTSVPGSECFAWQLDPPEVDHHVQSLKVALGDIEQQPGSLHWRVRGHLVDDNADDPFALCYRFTVVAWNEAYLDARADDANHPGNSNQAFNNGRIAASALAHAATATANPAASLSDPAVVLPRGFSFRWDSGDDHHLLQLAYKLDSGSAFRGLVEWETEGILKDDARRRDFTLREWVSVLGGRHVALEQPSFLLSPRSAPSADGCLTIDHPTYRVSEYELHGVPFDYAVPVLAGWDLWYPCGDEHVGEIGVWLHDIEYQKDADDPHGVLRYKVTSVLRDRDSRPGHRSRPRVSILGLRAPRPRTEDLRFEDAIVGFLSLAPDVHGRVLNGSDQSLWLTSGQEGGAQPEEFLFEVEYRGNMFLLEELAQHAPLELLPGEELIVGGRFLPSVPAPPGAPRSAWVDFAASDARWPSIRVHATGLTVAEDAAGHVLPEVIHFGFVDFQTSNHPLGFPVRNGFLGSNGQTPLLIESLSLTDPAIGFSFTVVQAPPFDGLLAPGVLYQVGPGHFLDFQVRFVPVVPGPVETTLVAETNVGRFEVRLLGEGVGTPPRPEFEVLRPRLGWPPATLTGR